jgi:WD40 repeat protein
VDDLDHILAKALERDPNRRYRNVKDLSDDLERHLNHVPVTARAPSTLYRAQKFARKNRGFIVAVSAIVLVSLCGTLVSLGLRSKDITSLENERWRTYVGNIASAGWRLERLKASGAGRQLQQAEEACRNWEWHDLELTRDISIETLESKAGAVRSLAWTKDGSVFFLGLSDGTISIRHRDDPSYERRLTGHDEAVDALAAAPTTRYWYPSPETRRFVSGITRLANAIHRSASPHARGP